MPRQRRSRPAATRCPERFPCPAEDSRNLPRSSSERHSPPDPAAERRCHRPACRLPCWQKDGPHRPGACACSAGGRPGLPPMPASCGRGFCQYVLPARAPGIPLEVPCSVLCFLKRQCQISPCITPYSTQERKPHHLTSVICCRLFSFLFHGLLCQVCQVNCRGNRQICLFPGGQPAGGSRPAGRSCSFYQTALRTGISLIFIFASTKNVLCTRISLTDIIYIEADYFLAFMGSRSIMVLRRFLRLTWLVPPKIWKILALRIQRSAGYSFM